MKCSRYCFLDTRHRLIEYREIFRSTIDGATVYPREVVREALMPHAAAVIFAHNHPSGVAEPIEADRSITIELSKALAEVNALNDTSLMISKDGRKVTCCTGCAATQRSRPYRLPFANGMSLPTTWLGTKRSNCAMLGRLHDNPFRRAHTALSTETRLNWLD